MKYGDAVILAHRIRLVTTTEQELYFRRACGVARFAYNWALAEWQRRYAAGEKPSESTLRKALNAVKDEQFPWMREVTKNAPQQEIKNLGRAYATFFDDLKRYRRADNGPEKTRPDAVQTDGTQVKLPITGWVKMRLYRRIADVRADALHKLATSLTRYQTVVIEDLNVAGMLANRHLARATAMAGSTIIVADRWYPSSKLCSACNAKNDNLILSNRTWTCASCGTSHDRDQNAAVNLARYPESWAGSACGAEGTGVAGDRCVNPAALEAGRFVHTNHNG